MNIFLYLLKSIQPKCWFADIAVGLLPKYFKCFKN